MESDSLQPRRIALALIGGLLALVLARLYFELLTRYQSQLIGWFHKHPIRLLLLFALAIVTSSVAAWLVQRTSAARLAWPIATLVGAITTAIYFSGLGIAVGFVVGLAFAAHHRFVFVRQLRRLVWPLAVLLAIAMAIGCLGRSAYYREWSAARPISVAIYALGSVLALMFVFGRGLEPRGADTDQAEPIRTWPKLCSIALKLALVIACLVPGIWLGWQLDVYRRIWILNRVGNVYQGVAGNLVGGAYGVFLGEAASDGHLRLLRGLPQIREISIHSAAITDDGCRHLMAMRELKLLDVWNVPIHDAGLRHIAGLPNLMWLFVQQTEVTRESFRVLTTLPSLTNIVMVDVMPEGPSLGDLQLPVTLQEVHLSACGLTDDDLAPLAKLKLIRRLTLRDNQIRGPGLIHVAQCTSLGSLYLGGNPIDDQHLSFLSPLTLNGLDLNGIQLTEAGIAAIEQQNVLEFLSVRESDITDQQLQRIVTATKLQDAELDATNLTPHSMNGWRPRDVKLYLEQQTLKASDIARLAKFSLDANLMECELTPDAVAELKLHPQMFILTNCRVGKRVVSGLYPYVNIP
jgi:hypothetical protein